MAQAIEAPGTPTDFAAILWVPDPEQRHWWREYYVQKATEKPNARPIGFGRPR